MEDEDEMDEEEENETEENAAEGEQGRVWRARRTLRKSVDPLWLFSALLTPCFSHLDAVRTIAFHPTEMCLASGGDDFTVKVWRLDAASLTATAYVVRLG